MVYLVLYMYRNTRSKKNGTPGRRVALAVGMQREVSDGALVAAPGRSLTKPTDSDDLVVSLQRENRRLLQTLEAASKLLQPSGNRHYKIDRIHLKGGWEGKWRARYGFRVIGIYDTEDEAVRHVALHSAHANMRVRRSEVGKAIL
jgi:mRNA-degrading endonuclease RelE of RelBE toxin-antitoxin system